MAVIHTEAFTVGANTDLPTHDSDWAYILGSNLNVRASTDDLRVSTTTFANQAARWNGTTVVDQKMTADLSVGSSSSTYLSVMVRAQSSNHNGYLCEWGPTENYVALYRVTGAGPTYTELDTGGAVSTSTTYANAYVLATGAGATVTLVGGDDTNGAATVSYSDTNAARYTSGQPGLTLYDGTVLLSSIDNVEIDDLLATAAGDLVTSTFDTYTDDFTIYLEQALDLGVSFSVDATHAIQPNPISGELSYSVEAEGTTTQSLVRHILGTLAFDVKLDRPLPSGVPFVDYVLDVLRIAADYTLSYSRKINDLIADFVRRY